MALERLTTRGRETAAAAGAEMLIHAAGCAALIGLPGVCTCGAISRTIRSELPRDAKAADGLDQIVTDLGLCDVNRDRARPALSRFQQD